MAVNEALLALSKHAMLRQRLRSHTPPQELVEVGGGGGTRGEFEGGLRAQVTLHLRESDRLACALDDPVLHAKYSHPKP